MNRTKNTLPYESYQEHLKTFKKNTPVIDRISYDQEKGDPFHIFDMDELERNYYYLNENLPEYRCHTAIKANPSEPVLKKLYHLGSSVDVASMEELVKWFEATGYCTKEDGGNFNEEMLSEAASKVIMSNPYVETADLVYALEHGVKSFVFASKQQIERLIDSCEIAQVPCEEINCIIRLAPNYNKNSFQQFSKAKYPVSPEYAKELIYHAKNTGLKKFGLSFHVGFQTPNASAWSNTFTTVIELIKSIKEKCGVQITTVDTGGGIPAIAIGNNANDNGKKIFNTLNGYKNELKSLGVTDFVFEPGNSMMSSAGLTLGSVVDMGLLMKEEEYENLKFSANSEELPAFIRIIANIGSFNSGIRDFMRTLYLVDKESDRVIPLYGQCKKNDPAMKDTLVFIGDTTCDDTGSLSKNGDYITKESYEYLMKKIHQCNSERDFFTGYENGIGILVTGTGSYGFSYASLNFNSKKPLTTYFVENQKIVALHEHPIPTSEKIAREKTIDAIETVKLKKELHGLQNEIEALRTEIDTLESQRRHNELSGSDKISKTSLAGSTELLVNRRVKKTNSTNATGYVGGYRYKKNTFAEKYEEEATANKSKVNDR